MSSAEVWVRTVRSLARRNLDRRVHYAEGRRSGKRGSPSSGIGSQVTSTSAAISCGSSGALEGAGLDPEAARVRDEETVEHYEQ